MRAAIDDNSAQRIDGFLCSTRKHLGETRTCSFELYYKSEWSVSDIADIFRRDPRTIKGEIYAMLSFFLVFFFAEWFPSGWVELLCIRNG